ncbi:hypothetical protein JCM5353_002929 [Sporobolomyces roseus]
MTNSEAAPLYPSTLAPDRYYQGKLILTLSQLSTDTLAKQTGLTERITQNLLPTFSKLFSLSSTSSVLEIASGYGVHSLIYSKAFPDITIQPTECDEFNRGKINETCREVSKGNEEGNDRGGVREALGLNVMEETSWEKLQGVERREGKEGEAKYDLVIGHNFIHMLPFPDGPRSIFRNLLKLDLVSRSKGLIAFYGPFKHDEGFYSEGDVAFDKEISSRPSSYPLGLRSIDAIARIAEEEGWEFVKKVPMPVGNWVLLYKVKGAQVDLDGV